MDIVYLRSMTYHHHHHHHRDQQQQPQQQHVQEYSGFVTRSDKWVTKCQLGQFRYIDINRQCNHKASYTELQRVQYIIPLPELSSTTKRSG